MWIELTAFPNLSVDVGEGGGLSLTLSMNVSEQYSSFFSK